MDCIFCKIAQGEIPSAKVYEDEDFLAFLDINPVNKGHTLVITKEHYETLTELDEALLQKMIVVVQQVSESINKNLEPDGYNVFVNNKKAAGQEIPHIHFHIMPRYKEDGLKFNWPHQKYAEGEMEKFVDKISLD